VKVEIWSDVVCPWCYIGKRRFETALEKFEHRDQVEVVWRSFELDPSAPPERTGDLADHLARKYGMTRERALASQSRLTDLAAEEGLEFDFARARPGNTFEAHRLIHLAAEHGRQDQMKEVLLDAYFRRGLPIGDRDTLVELAAEAGIAADEARAMFESRAHATAVKEDEADAAELGATGVPFFVFDRAYAVSGAQSPEVLLDVLEQAWAARRPTVLTPLGARGPVDDSCEDGSCDV
jgi:predicted DsbA family dithiol-disulfide isomerase